MNSFLPMNEAVLSGGLALFTKVAGILMGFVSVIFMMRLVFLVVKISPAPEYGELIQDTVMFLGMLAIYPIILKLIVFSIEDLAVKIAYIPQPETQSLIKSFLDRLFYNNPIFQISGSIGHIILASLAQSVYTALISLFVASAPIFIFLSTMLGIHSGLRSYFGILISLCLWPVMWNLLGQLGTQVGMHFMDSPVSTFCFWTVIQILQLLSPLFTFGLFKNMSTGVGLAKVALVGRFFL